MRERVYLGAWRSHHGGSNHLYTARLRVCGRVLRAFSLLFPIPTTNSHTHTHTYIHPRARARSAMQVRARELVSRFGGLALGAVGRPHHSLADIGALGPTHPSLAPPSLRPLKGLP